MQYVAQLRPSNRALVVPLVAALLGAGVATTTFAIVNIEDAPTVSPAVQSAVPSDAVAGQRADGGPAEGTAQQSMTQAELRGSNPSAAATPAPRYDGGPHEGAASGAMQQSAGGSDGATQFGGARP